MKFRLGRRKVIVASVMAITLGATAATVVSNLDNTKPVASTSVTTVQSDATPVNDSYQTAQTPDTSQVSPISNGTAVTSTEPTPQQITPPIATQEDNTAKGKQLVVDYINNTYEFYPEVTDKEKLLDEYAQCWNTTFNQFGYSSDWDKMVNLFQNRRDAYCVSPLTGKIHPKS